jgi:hypothetical protein
MQRAATSCIRLSYFQLWKAIASAQAVHARSVVREKRGIPELISETLDALI